MLLQQTKLTQELNKRERKMKGQTIINSSETPPTLGIKHRTMTNKITTTKNRNLKKHNKKRATQAQQATGN